MEAKYLEHARIKLNPDLWQSDELTEDVSSLRQNPEVSAFTDGQLEDAWGSYCRNVMSASWMTPTGREPLFIAFLAHVQRVGLDDCDTLTLNSLVDELWG